MPKRCGENSVVVDGDAEIYVEHCYTLITYRALWCRHPQKMCAR